MYPNLLRVSMPRSSLPNNYYLILGRVSAAIILSIVEKIFDSLQDNAVLSVSNNGKKVSSPISSFFSSAASPSELVLFLLSSHEKKYCKYKNHRLARNLS